MKTGMFELNPFGERSSEVPENIFETPLFEKKGCKKGDVVCPKCKKESKKCKCKDMKESSDESDLMDEPLTEDTEIPVPGGYKERPSTATKEVSISSNKTEISVDEYNDLLVRFKKTFKQMGEAVESMQELTENVTIVPGDTEEVDFMDMQL